MSQPSAHRATVVIAGASGFVGSALGRELGEDFRVVGLGRHVTDVAGGGFAAWRQADFLSLLDAVRALADASISIYLIHSMMPSARLTQGGFQDFDLIAADNFARAAKLRGVRRIIYLGGLIPDGEKLSAHLQSRLEVEAALKAYGTPVTTLRAGIIVGAGGSSFAIVKRLVERLPVMLCPAWTRVETQPIALAEVVALLGYCARHPETEGQTYDVGGPDVMTYEALMRETAHVMGKPLRTFSVPFFTPGLSRLWIMLITGAPASLVRPLIKSLRHRMTARDRRLQEAAGIPGAPFREVVRDAIRGESLRARREEPLAFVGNRRGAPVLDVSSVQRFALPADMSATDVAREYMRWLPRMFPRLLRVVIRGGVHCEFFLWPMRTPLLTLRFAAERSNAQRALFYVEGGFLARNVGRGRLEFRGVLGRRYLVAAVLGFRPRLPWRLYKVTQAPLHRLVMAAFGRHLRRREPPRG